MSIHLLRERATPEQMLEMLAEFGSYIKFAVDIQRNLAAGGGELHADCKKALLEDGSREEAVWGADWDPFSRTVKFEALINIQPRQDNPTLQILDPAIRTQVEAALLPLLGSLE